MAITLLEMLLEARQISADQCDEALQNRVFFGGRIGTNLIELGFLSEEDLARFLSKKLLVPFVEPRRLLNLSASIIERIPRELAIKYQVVPIGQENRRLSLVMADPFALTAIDEISFITGRVIRPLIAPEVRVIQALGKYYGFEIDERYRRIIEQIDAPPRKVEPLEPESPEPESTEREALAGEVGGEWARQIERYSVGRISQLLARAESREEIADALMCYLSQEFSRVGLFMVRRDAASGWRAVRGGEEVEGFSMVHIPLTRPSVLKTVLEAKSFYLGTLADCPLNARLLDGLGGGGPAAVLVMPLTIGGRVASLLYVEGARRDLDERGAELTRLLGKAGLAFEILVAREKILMA